MALARLLQTSGNADGALEILKQPTDAQSPDLYELLGDLEASRGHSAEARTAYDQAQKLSSDSASRKRIERKRQAVK